MKFLLAGTIFFFCSFANGQANQQKDAEGFVTIFDGKTLNNWIGDTTYWKVEDGCLVGVVTPATLLKRNTFIIWQGQMPESFEIKVEFTIDSTN